MVVLDHPVVRHKTTLLRSVDTDTRLFRALVHEISLLVLYEATRLLPTEPVRVQTPMAPYDGARVPGSKLAIVPVLRAGLGMLDAALELLPHAPVGFVGVTRDEETLRPVPYYLKLPDGLTGRSVLVLDPMLATGGSASHAIGICREAGATDITPGRADRRARGHRAAARGAAGGEHLRGRARRAPERRRLHRPRSRGRGRPDVRHAVKRPALLAALLLAAAALAPFTAAARVTRVTTNAELTAALAAAAPGDTIQLAPGAYAPVTISGRGGPGADLTIAGDSGATIAGMTITGSQRIVVSGLGVAPAATAASIHVASSSTVTFRGLQLDGGAGGAGASMDIAATATGVVIADSTFLHCSSPFCIRTMSPDVVIQHNTFDDLDDSDAVHGFGGGVIRANHMDHALPHGGGNHNDFIQIGAGGPWTIDGNWFGVRTGGAASIWLDPINGGLIHDAVIENNVVTGHYAGQYVGIFVGGDGTSVALLPRNITVINNTVISGLANSLRFGRGYATLPVAQRPLVVNNTGERLLDMCDRIRSGHNVFAAGQACSASDVIGNPHLDATGAPTAASTLLIDRGDPTAAPPDDFFGYARTVGAPDIGAIEFGATGARTRAGEAPPPRALRVRARRRGSSTGSSCACAPPTPSALR